MQTGMFKFRHILIFMLKKIIRWLFLNLQLNLTKKNGFNPMKTYGSNPMPTVEKPRLKFTGYQPASQAPTLGNEGGSPILPPGTTALTRNYAEHWRDAYNEVKYCFEEGMIPEAAMYELLEAMPSETLRELVRKIAGTDASFLMTFTKQVRLVDAVLNQLVYADGRLKETAARQRIRRARARLLLPRRSDRRPRRASARRRGSTCISPAHCRSAVSARVSRPRGA